MPTSLQSTSPEYRAIVAANTAIIAVFTIELNATGRSLALKVGGSTVLSWDGTTTTVASGYSGSVTLSETTLTVTLTKTGGWTHATGVVWSVSYTDSVTNSIQRDGAHIYLTETLEMATPPSGSRDAARRPWVLTEASASAGTVTSSVPTPCGIPPRSPSHSPGRISPARRHPSRCRRRRCRTAR